MEVRLRALGGGGCADEEDDGNDDDDDAFLRPKAAAFISRKRARGPFSVAPSSESTVPSGRLRAATPVFPVARVAVATVEEVATSWPAAWRAS